MRPRKRKILSPLTGGSTFTVNHSSRGRKLSIQPSQRRKRSFTPAYKRSRVSRHTSPDPSSSEEGDDDGPLESLTIDISNMGGYQAYQTQPDYMRRWMLNYREYLMVMLEREAPPKNGDCLICGRREGIYRCDDCIGRTFLCAQCCKSEHAEHQLHRIQRWTGEHYEPAWLWSVGVVVHLGHYGEPCPKSSYRKGDTGPTKPSDDDVTYGASPPGRKIHGCPVLLVVHTNGIHHLPVAKCNCEGAAPFPFQLLGSGFYPSTEDEPRSVFTCQLLDYYLTETLECHTSTYNFFGKLRRLTNETFPSSVPDRYRELLRVGRQWRHLKELAAFGYANRSDFPGPGGLALFCAACPQPGINLPRTWIDDLRRWLYMRGFVIDGNFKCIHRMQKGGTKDIGLKAGEGYVTAPIPYSEHVLETTEEKERSKCYDHRAIADRSKPHKGCDVSGIGALACSRHGAFVPMSVVDFQKGERQLNIDYGVTQGLRYGPTLDAPAILLLYDIGCQYSTNAKRRMNANDRLLDAEDLDNVIWGIGTWHVHGHKERCMARYSPSFIPGAGMTSGEILESLWSTLNDVGRTSSVMTLPHRMEVLDAHMLDSNWKKMLGLIPALSKNLLSSRKEQDKAYGDYKALSSTASPSQISTWTLSMDNALDNRKKNVAAMDVFNVTEKLKQPTRKRVQADLMENEDTADDVALGVTKWLSLGLDIQEQHGKAPSDTQTIDIATKRDRLAMRIQEFYKGAESLFPLLDVSELELAPPPVPHCICDAEDCDHTCDTSNPLLDMDGLPEFIQIALPSACLDLPPVWQRAVKKEVKLRIAQASDCLERIRLEVGNKTFLFRANINLASGKKDRLRGYSGVAASNRTINYLRSLYRQTLWALTRLGASKQILQDFKPILPADIKPIAHIYNHRERGHRNSPPSWIWSQRLSSDLSNDTYLNELHRVNWFKARARHARWVEEHTLIAEEMQWVLNYFSYQAEQSSEWAELPNQTAAQKAWSSRRSAMWSRLRRHALAKFNEARSDSDSTGYEESAIGVNESSDTG
ncbi:hypothetical protein DFP72DRAFT_992875 [Ephemerocybe angulata]|uniref:CxC2-like cysteine cluster KDZ transposase-associated domain-containing protein n=1 Tax=Ephemerocybe angulata TaxID=980116 RepID=A0A8H6HFN1_9AGAR|nr:hypothetical protein DFP72DRAFT_992875 [Tulosesus angulatus]